MNKAELDFIELSRQVVISDLEVKIQTTNWSEVYNLLKKNGLAAFTYEHICNREDISVQMKTDWDSLRLSVFVKQKKCFHGLKQLIAAFDKNGIFYRVFKGVVVADCYINPYYRSSSDDDILINERDYNQVHSIFTELGYSYAPQKDNVCTYFNKVTGHYVELHFDLYENYEGVNIDILKGYRFDIENTIEVMIDGVMFKTLGHTEHFIYLLYHLIKHFMLEGARIRFLTDLVVFVNKYYDEIDLDYFWKVIGEIHYEEFTKNILSICIDLYGMKNVLCGRKETISQSNKELLLLDLTYNGDVEGTRGESWQLVGNIIPYFVGELNSVKKNRFVRTISFIFPSPAEMNTSYSYAKKCVILLPIAWIHRIVKLVFHQLKGTSTNDYSAIKRVEVVHSRLDVLGKVGLIQEK